MSVLTRRNFVKTCAAFAGACALPFVAPESALALPLSEGDAASSEWDSIVAQCEAENASAGPIKIIPVSTSVERIGEIETINVTDQIYNYAYAGTFTFYCTYRAALNPYGVKVFDEILGTGVYADNEVDEVKEVYYNEYVLLDGNRTCQVQIGAVFGVSGFGGGLLPGTKVYLNQALAVEFYAPYNTGQVFMP